MGERHSLRRGDVFLPLYLPVRSDDNGVVQPSHRVAASLIQLDPSDTSSGRSNENFFREIPVNIGVPLQWNRELVKTQFERVDISGRERRHFDQDLMKNVLLCLVLVAGVVWMIRDSGRILVIDQPKKSDAIVVLAGDSGDDRYWRGRELLRAGYGRSLLLDASEDYSIYGRKPADLAAHFIEDTIGDARGHIVVCPIAQDSTLTETIYVRRCLEQQNARSVLLVTSDYHTRRAYSIFSHRLPEYRWSVAAARDDYTFGEKWWRKREWAKTALAEYARLLWWELVDRWRFEP